MAKVMFRNGRVLFSPGKKIAMDVACCCGSCQFCTAGHTPDQFTVTPADVVNCAGTDPDATGMNGHAFVCPRTVSDENGDCFYTTSWTDGNDVEWVCQATVTSSSGPVMFIVIFDSATDLIGFTGFAIPAPSVECDEVDETVTSLNDLGDCGTVCGYGGTAAVAAGP